MDLLGWIGSSLLAFCALPQALESWRSGHSKGVTWGLLVMWGLGEVFMIAYVWPRGDIPLLANYLSNLALMCFITFYKVWPRS